MDIQNNALAFLVQSMQELRKKMSLKDNVAQIRNARFYLPNYPVDCIQKCMIDGNDYWDMQAHHIINKYLKDNSVILDIGANIGSHTVYWAIERHAKKIYAFEPLKGTFEILEKNVELNGLNDRVVLYNLGLSDEETKAGVAAYNMENIGGTSFQKTENGVFTFVPLDSIAIKENIDLIKIDVEGAEVDVLMGGLKTLKKDKPIVVIESFHNKAVIDTIFAELGYKQIDTIREGEDYIYKFAG